MLNTNFQDLLQKELERIDSLGIQKRNERIIEGFNKEHGSTKAKIKKKNFLVFNSNDYLGLRHNSLIANAEHKATKKYGTGPGAVRFISGTLKIYKDLESEISKFHKKESAMLFSSGFATNLGVIQALVKGPSKDSLINSNTLIVSDELNHRSIIDGIRVSGLSKESRLIFKHKDTKHLDKLLDENKNKFDRVIVITDGIFSMLGNFQDLKETRKVIDKHKQSYSQGILLVVDDCHGVGCFGKTGRGVEEHTKAKADLLVGTFGKAFGVDGGYIVADKLIVDYLKESTATYIYSNPVSPGCAGASLQAVKIVNSASGQKRLSKLNDNISYFKKKLKNTSYKLAQDSSHAIQPILIGDSKKTKELVNHFFKNEILVTNISYPIVPKGQDEIRVQLSSSHTKKDIDAFFEVLNMFQYN